MMDRMDHFPLKGALYLNLGIAEGCCKTTLEDKQKIGNLTYYISSENLRDAESENNN